MHRLELPTAFVLAQIGICLLAVIMALRLRLALRAVAPEPVLIAGRTEPRDGVTA